MRRRGNKRGAPPHRRGTGSRVVTVSLDPGTNFGWAVFLGTKRVESGTWLLRGKSKQQGPKYLRTVKALENLVKLVEHCKTKYGSYPRIAYEKVQRHGKQSGVDAAHVYGRWLACLDLVEAKYSGKITILPVQVKEWKKTFTGNGNASKEMYVKAANLYFDLQLNVEDNEDEAAALGVGYHLVRGRKP